MSSLRCCTSIPTGWCTRWVDPACLTTTPARLKASPSVRTSAHAGRRRITASRCWPRISTPIHAELGLRTGDRARIGIRPADVSIHSEAATDDSTVNLPGKVLLSERLGRNIELTIDMGGTWLIGLSRGGLLAEEGAEVVVRVPIWDVQVFKPAAEGEDSVRIGNLDPEGGSDQTHRDYMAAHPTTTSATTPGEGNDQ